MYVLALSDYKLIFKASCLRGLKKRPPIRQINYGLPVSVSAMLVYIHQKKYRSSFILERYFFVSIYPAAIPGTYLAMFLVAVLQLC